MKKVLEAYAADIEERVAGPEQKVNSGWQANVHEIVDPGPVYSDGKWLKSKLSIIYTADSIRIFGYRFSSSDRTIVWAGDGIASTSYLEAAQNADILFSDVSSAKDNGCSYTLERFKERTYQFVSHSVKSSGRDCNGGKGKKGGSSP